MIRPSNLILRAKRALWNNLGQNEELALKIDVAVREQDALVFVES
jgi:hypothetical protein